MKCLHEKLRKFGLRCIFIYIFLIAFTFLSYDVVSSKEFDVPLYIMENNDYSEFFIDKSIMENYYVEKFLIKDKNVDKNMEISYIDNRFIIHEKLKNNNEYSFDIVLVNKENNKRKHVNLKLNYIQSKFDFKRIHSNSYRASVGYDKRNLIFIENIKVFGEDVSRIGTFDFNISRNKSQLENYNSKVNFNDINLKPGTTYNVYCSVELKNGITVISKQKVKTKSFTIDELESKMVGDRKIKIDWKISDNKVKFRKGDSVKVYVKLLKDFNYAQTPNLEINNFDENSAVIEAREISPKYEVKLVYTISGKNFEKTVKQVNDFYKINSNVYVSNSRVLKVKFYFDRSYKFNNEQILNLYLIEGENDETYTNKIFSSKINQIKFNPTYKFEFNDLNPGRNYKVIYEILNEDGSVLKIKEDKFTTPIFDIKNMSLTTLKDKKGDAKINLKWELNDPEIKFSPNDSLSIYVKNNGHFEEDKEPFYYQDKDLNHLYSLNLNANEFPNGDYEIKLVYNIGGNIYSKIGNVNINFENNDIKFFSKGTPGSQGNKVDSPPSGSSGTQGSTDPANPDSGSQDSSQSQGSGGVTGTPGDSGTSGSGNSAGSGPGNPGGTDGSQSEGGTASPGPGTSGGTDAGGTGAGSGESTGPENSEGSQSQEGGERPESGGSSGSTNPQDSGNGGGTGVGGTPVGPGTSEDTQSGEDTGKPGGQGQGSEGGTGSTNPDSGVSPENPENGGDSESSTPDGQTDPNNGSGSTGDQESGGAQGNSETPGGQVNQDFEIPEYENSILQTQKEFKIKVLPTKVTQTEIELQFLHYKKVKFKDGDTLEIKYRPKDQNNWIVYENYIHADRPEIAPRVKEQQDTESGPTDTDNNNNGSESDSDKKNQHKINFTNIETVVLNNLIPNKEYDFEIKFHTEDSIKIESKEESDTGKENDKDKNRDTVSEEKEDGKNDVTTDTGKVERTDTKIDLKVTTEKFEIKTFSAETVRTNSAVLNWTLNSEPIVFKENDKVEIFVKRKIVGGYPVGSSFSKSGSELKGLNSAEIVVNHMKMDYTAKIVYTINGAKFEKTVDFTTKEGRASCSIDSINEYSATLNIKYPEDYKFLNDDYIEIYIKEHEEKKFGFPLISIVNTEDEKIEDITSIQLSYLNPKMSYDVLIKFINKANDIPDCETSFITSAVVLGDCRIDSMSGDKLRVKTNFLNNPEIMKYIDLDAAIFYKKSSDRNYYETPLLDHLKNENSLDVEVPLPDVFEDYDLLVSYRPHGGLSDTLYVEFELGYRTIKPTINISTREDENVKYNVYDLNWTYPENIQFSQGDKIDIYLKEIISTEEENSNGNGESASRNRNAENYVKIHTIDSDLSSTNAFNLDYFLNDKTKYEVIVHPVMKNYQFGFGKADISVEKQQSQDEEQKPNEEIFENPIDIGEFQGSGGNTLKFTLPEEVKELDITQDMNIKSDIEGLKFSLDEDGQINVRGLVPGKSYEKIEVKVVVAEGKEITFSLENIKLEPEEEVQGFLFNVYQRSFLRDPDESGYNYWIDRLKQKTITARNFLINLLFAEKEFSQMEYTTEKLISVLYSIIVNREPDKEGLGFWINFYNNEALKNSGGDVFVAKKYIVDRMINEKEFEKLMVGMGVEY